MNEVVYQNFGRLQPDQNFVRTGKLFKTKNHTYFYDSGTGKVFECEGYELVLLQALLQPDGYAAIRKLLDDPKFEQAFYNIIDLVNEDHILQRKVCDHVTEDEDSPYLQQITLELTQACNLRCKYCIYNDDFDKFRDFSSKRMSWDIAKKALDYAAEHCGNEITIGFYGGEPLLEFSMIQACVEYCNTIFNGVKLTYTLTTNLTLITKDIAEYLSSIDAKVVCSLDGPLDIHDKFRVFQTGKGSHEQAIKGLRLLVEAYGTKASTHLSIHSVVCPPYTKEYLDHIKSYFEELDWLPKEIPFDMAYVDSGSLKEQDGGMVIDGYSPQTFYAQTLERQNPIKAWCLNYLCDSKLSRNDYIRKVENQILTKMHLRLLTELPSEHLYRNGCCNPGKTRIYVCTNGDFKVCEKIGSTKPIGNVEIGLDKQLIKKDYKTDFDEYIVKTCNDCWAANLCLQCYANCYDEQGFNPGKKDHDCFSCRANAENNLIEYYQILEEQPLLLEELEMQIQNQS